MKRMLTPHLSTRTYRWLRRLSYVPLDLWDRVRGAADPLNPPRHKAFVYGFDPDFRVVGNEFLRYFTEIAGLRPDEAVLDIGCGIGRLALPLTAYLTTGRYEGFDAIREGIDWCQRHIAPRHPNFRFTHADILNATYNPSGRYRAAEYRFPYPDGAFDFAFTKSVFTHMFPPDVRHYLRECARVLKPGGRCLHTFFLLNDEARALMKAGAAQFDFSCPGPGYRSVSAREPEKAIAFEERDVLGLFRDCGLTVVPPVHYGFWCGRSRFLGGQDIVLAVKQP